MKHTTVVIQATAVVVKDYNGNQIGVVATMILPGAFYPISVAQAHDWDGDNEGSYDPINLGAFADPVQAHQEIMERAYEQTSSPVHPLVADEL